MLVEIIYENAEGNVIWKHVLTEEERKIMWELRWYFFPMRIDYSK